MNWREMATWVMAPPVFMAVAVAGCGPEAGSSEAASASGSSGEGTTSAAGAESTGAEDTTGEPVVFTVYVDDDGDDANPGTLEAPVARLQRGIEVALGLGLDTADIGVAEGTYVVDDDDPLVVPAGLTIHGGFVQGDWSTRGGLTEVVGQHVEWDPENPDGWNAVTMLLDDADGEVEDLTVRSSTAEFGTRSAIVIQGSGAVELSNVVSDGPVHVRASASALFGQCELTSLRVSDAGEAVVEDSRIEASDASVPAVEFGGTAATVVDSTIVNGGVTVTAGSLDLQRTVIDGGSVSGETGTTVSMNDTVVTTGDLLFSGTDLEVYGGELLGSPSLIWALTSSSHVRFEGAATRSLDLRIDAGALVEIVGTSITIDEQGYDFKTAGVDAQIGTDGGTLRIDGSTIRSTPGSYADAIVILTRSADAEITIHNNDVAVFDTADGYNKLLEVVGTANRLDVVNNAFASNAAGGFNGAGGVSLPDALDQFVGNTIALNGAVAFPDSSDWGGPIGERIVHNNLFVNLDSPQGPEDWSSVCLAAFDPEQLVVSSPLSIHNNAFWGCSTLLLLDDGTPINALADSFETADGTGTLAEWGNVLADPLFPEPIDEAGAAQLPSPQASCELRQGGRDGLVDGWGFDVDLVGADRTPDLSCGPSNPQAAGWSIGAVEQDQ